MASDPTSITPSTSPRVMKLTPSPRMSPMNSPAKSALEAFEEIKGLDISLNDRLKQMEMLLRKETRRANQLESELKKVRAASIAAAVRAEEEEESIANDLIKKLNRLKWEKTKLALEVEQEEEHLTNSLMRKLHGLKLEKVELENSLEQEQEFFVNKLQRRLNEVMAEKAALESRLLESTSQVMQHLEDTGLSCVVADVEQLRRSEANCKSKCQRLEAENGLLRGELEKLKRS